jgi:site-specific DNA-methyltransferase (adenine-specific)
MGVGSSIVTAHKLNRRFLGVEIEKKYCLLAAKRLEIAKLDPSIQGYTDGVFWERNTLSVQKTKTKNKHPHRAEAACFAKTPD